MRDKPLPKDGQQGRSRRDMAIPIPMDIVVQEEPVS